MIIYKVFWCYNVILSFLAKVEADNVDCRSADYADINVKDKYERCSAVLINVTLPETARLHF